MQPTICTKANLDLTELTVRLESQLPLGRKGAREDRCWPSIPTIPTDALHLFCLGKQNYISQEAVRLLSPPLPALRLSRPAPLRDPLIYKGRMARPWAECGGGAGARCAGGAGWTRPPQLAPANLLFPPRASLSLRAPTLLCLGPADLQTRDRERICPWYFPGLGREVPAGIWVRGGDAQPRKARSCVQAGCCPSARRRNALAGGGGAPSIRLFRAAVPRPGNAALGNPSQ